MTRTSAGLRKSVEQFERAVAKAPTYAAAYAGLADALALLAGAGYGASQHGLVRRAKAAATRAAVLDEMLPEAYTSLAFLRFKFDWDWPGAERSYRRAIELGPSLASAHHWYALFLSAMGRHREAAVRIERARRLDPLSLIIRAAASRVHQFGGDLDRGIDLARQALELDPEYAEAHFNLGMCFLYQERFEEAIRELRRALALSPERPLFLALLGNALARSGRREEAREILRRLRTLSDQRRVSPVELAILYIGMGETDRAFEQIDAAIASRDGMIVFLEADLVTEKVRDDPRYRACLSRLGLRPSTRRPVSPAAQSGR